ncbi:AHH domain-containing protein [Vitiosangium sp. GDMCC 1.1324]|uniref:AHH domain-containing protein n=1 Tax=Vitiosangium sp. (strain GDMCC 1.1324) TaxID=2138576 RepID=UPI000D3A3404|nr:AHH domain-containing protein [Vitiosangium sp. GDMCC 1.1324]PTL84215.1 hypothetical protein DAT35_12345 [Vitiosangium sp. GDMCC 1.1324]
MNTRGRRVSLQELMLGAYVLYGRAIANGRPNIRDFGPTPGSSGAMKRNEQRKQQVQATKDRRSQQSNGQQYAGTHVNSQAQYRAILAKGSSYASNGATYIRSNRPLEYSTFSHLGPSSFQVDVTSRASIAQASNFNPTLSGQSQPYPWRAHHMIPGEAFYTEDSNGQPIFDKQENFDILRQTPYDIDHGHNMILLPSVPWAVPVHALMQHPNNHNGYTLEVMDRLKLIDSDIDTLRGQGKPHEAIVADVFEALKRLESDLWDDLLEESRAAVRGAAEGQRHDGPWCRWKTQEGREYLWPALW